MSDSGQPQASVAAGGAASPPSARLAAPGPTGSQPAAGPVAAVAQVRARWEALRAAAIASQNGHGHGPMGWLWLRDVQLTAHLGITAHERRSLQTLRLHCGLKVDIGAAAAVDRIGATVDWASVAARLQQVADNQSWHLAESLTLALCQDLLAQTPTAQVQCDLIKPGCLPSGEAMVSLRLRRPHPVRPGAAAGRQRRAAARPMGDAMVEGPSLSTSPALGLAPAAQRGPAAPAPQPSGKQPSVAEPEVGGLAACAVHHVALQVRDLAGALLFWRDQLGFGEGGRQHDDDGLLQAVWLRLGEGAWLLLQQAAAANAPCTSDPAPRSAPAAAGGCCRLALRISLHQRQQWENWLAARGVAVAQRSAHALYIDDPQGNRLALSHYPQSA